MAVSLIADTSPPALVLDSQGSHKLLGKIRDGFVLGPTAIGMPFTLNNAIRLTYAGYETPSPILMDYTWPRDETTIPFPFDNQIATAEFFTLNPRSYCLNDIGTGKTMSALWAADYLISRGHARRVIVVSTVSTLERVWGDALFLNFQHRTFNVLAGSAERRRRLLAQPRDFYIVNYEGLIVLKNEICARSDIDVVILDEVAELSNHRTDKWEAARDFATPVGGVAKPWVWGMTGTPTPRSPEEAYGQCRLITPSTIPKLYVQWRAMVMDHQAKHIWTPRHDANRIVQQAMRPAIRFSRAECIDLPPEIHQTRQVTLSAEQQRHYKDIMRDFRTEIAGNKVTALNEGIKLSKLMQIACGVVYDVAGNPQELDASNRLEVLLEVIEQVNEKVIVFVPFTAVTTMLLRELNKHWNFAVVTGEVSMKERDRIFAEFQNPESDMDLLAHPECMAHGLTLTEASTIIWYAPIDSSRIYTQANGRISRPGQRHTQNIVHLSGSPVERRAYKRLRDRQAMQGVLLDMIAAGEG